MFRYYDVVRDVRQNKGSILRATVEYIKILKQDQECWNVCLHLVAVRFCTKNLSCLAGQREHIYNHLNTNK